MAQPVIVHADAALLLVDKPAGVLAVPGRGDGAHDNLTSHLQALFGDALVVHRLDMATSGLMLFARGAEMHRRLSIAFAERQVDKRYVAVVEGSLHGDSGHIDAPLRADWPNRPRQVVDALHGKPSLTRWQVVARLAGATRVELQPVTGRSHQLRVHLQSIGHPIRGDTLYAPAPPHAPRLLLHASRLALRHPGSGVAVEFSSTPPF